MESSRRVRVSKWNHTNLGEIEVCNRGNSYLPLSWVDEKSGRAGTAIPASFPLVLRDDQRSAPNLRIENAPEFPDRSERWILNRGVLYYWPESDEPENDVAYPRLTELVRVEGTATDDRTGDRPIQNITLRKLRFTGTDRERWTEREEGLQHDWDMYDNGNAMLRFRSARNCRVEACTFSHGAAMVRD